MSNAHDIIAWLVPTARGSPADKATLLSANISRTVSISSSIRLLAKLSHLSTCPPQKAIQLCFSQRPRRAGRRFVLGSDANSCDVLLPDMPGISAQHCSIGFDAESRLVLDDFSERGTQVWYDWECSGDQRDCSWVLSSRSRREFPGAVGRIAIDIQGVRFHVVLNDHFAHGEAYEASVAAFCAQPRWTGCLASWAVDPSLCSQPLIQHVFVKGHGGEPTGEMYLWDMSRPWEPMVRASA
ncbi:hypothetical protein ED733_001998 [Metarhizium rileyi]|uniref:FHA domain-containing protein n=1 Tax=Metarhizium rileyi (strain RCEF 4871) TaxID=1649241 RepID=A0A5C6G5X3_METRR|nr:hypothetical protein ED733_001998 [Metarhizium rileyi]